VGGDHVTGVSRDRPRRYAEAHYEIWVGGHLGETIQLAFPTLGARAQRGNTVLSGLFTDQAALFGVLSQLEALGLELIEVRRLPPP
jgi:hypothetical protein